MKPQQVAQGVAALANYKVYGLDRGPDHTYMWAEANTGSKYVVTSVREPGTYTGETWAVALFSPWEAAYLSSAGGKLHPGYVIEKWGGGRDIRNMHGGDIWIVTKMIAQASNCSYYHPGEFK